MARHKVLTGLGALVLLLIIVGVVGGGGGTTPSDDAAGGGTAASDDPAGGTAAKAEGKQAAAVGTAVRDGKFEFTVSKVQCGVPSVGPAALGQNAQGQYCLVTVKVSNIGDKPQTLDSSSQYGYDPAGRKLSPDDAAGLYANPAGGGAFLNEINPGNAATAVLVFDIPKDGKLTRLELHDSPFSGGVSVKVG
jgi:hypothetical protein